MTTPYHTHPEYRALLAGIIAQPECDLRRLVLADWIEEQGDHDRAVYIRCEVAVPADKPRVCEKTGTTLTVGGVVGPLFVPHCRCRICSTVRKAYMASRRFITWEWVGGVGPAALLVDRSNWCRGFVESVYCTLDGWLRGGADLVAIHPVVEVEFEDKYPLEGDNDPDPVVWHWVPTADSDPRPMQWEVPKRVYDRMPETSFDSCEKANAALVLAAVEYVRSVRPEAVPA